MIQQESYASGCCQVPLNYFNYFAVEIVAISAGDFYLVDNSNRHIAATTALLDTTLDLNIQFRKLLFQPPDNLALTLVLFTKTNLN